PTAGRPAASQGHRQQHQSGPHRHVFFFEQKTAYEIAPAAVEANTDRAALNRLTITVKVKYTNRLDDTGDSDFEQSFSQFREFAGMIQGQEENLTREIINLLTEDIYNRAFANW